MEQYHQLLQYILNYGIDSDDRTGTGTLSVFGYENRYDLTKGFPLVTTKEVSVDSIIIELLWFLRGDTNIRTLAEQGVNIWNSDAYKAYRKYMGLPDVHASTPEFKSGLKEFKVKILADAAFAEKYGDLGPTYGRQWRSWPSPDGGQIDQISNLIADLQKNPDSRRLIVTAWNPADVPKMTLPPCHCMFHFRTYKATPQQRLTYWVQLYPEFKRMVDEANVTHEAVDALEKDGKVAPYRTLICKLYQRSADSLLGVPYNIASYALLTMMIAQVCDMIPFEFIHSFGDLHIYKNHLEQVNLQLSRDVRPWPQMIINPNVKDIFSFTINDFKLEDYDPHPAIIAPLSV